LVLLERKNCAYSSLYLLSQDRTVYNIQRLINVGLGHTRINSGCVQNSIQLFSIIADFVSNLVCLYI